MPRPQGVVYAHGAPSPSPWPCCTASYGCARFGESVGTGGTDITCFVQRATGALDLARASELVGLACRCGRSPAFDGLTCVRGRAPMLERWPEQLERRRCYDDGLWYGQVLMFPMPYIHPVTRIGSISVRVGHASSVSVMQLS